MMVNAICYTDSPHLETGRTGGALVSTGIYRTEKQAEVSSPRKTGVLAVYMANLITHSPLNLAGDVKPGLCLRRRGDVISGDCFLRAWAV